MIDGTPTHSWMHWRYRYPQAEYPYQLLREENARRGRDEREFELADTGVLDGDRFFDVDVMYAKAPYTTIRRAVHIHPTVSELVPTMMWDLKPL